MYFSRSGRGKPPVVFIHGYGCDSSDWQAQFDELAELTTVIACDLPGHGRSAEQRSEVTIETCGGAVAQLLTDLRLPPTVLVGHSMGCRVVLQTYVAAQERVSGIVLLDGSFTGKVDPGTAQREIARQIADVGYSTFIYDFFDQMFFDPCDQKTKSAILERALALPENVGTRLFVDLVGWDAGAMATALASVSVPILAIQSTTLQVGGGRKQLAPGQTSGWLELIRENAHDIEIVYLPGTGHFPHIEKATEVSALITDFISRLRQPTTS